MLIFIYLCLFLAISLYKPTKKERN